MSLQLKCRNIENCVLGEVSGSRGGSTTRPELSSVNLAPQCDGHFFMSSQALALRNHHNIHTSSSWLWVGVVKVSRGCRPGRLLRITLLFESFMRHQHFSFLLAAPKESGRGLAEVWLSQRRCDVCRGSSLWDELWSLKGLTASIVHF